MPIISNFPKNQIVTNESIDIKSIPKKTKLYYKNLIKYLDEYIYFIYLKFTDNKYGLTLGTQLPYYLRVDVSVSLEKAFYQRHFPDDEEIQPLILSIIEENFKNDIYEVTPEIIEFRKILGLD
tara:strand:- start:388 stop:756 length:369 start_codon:yes stop_codon:yes gene_type:complete